MAETQDRQSLFCDPPSASARTDPPGLRRLRFPFFKPLVKERASAAPPYGQAFAGQHGENETRNQASPGKPRLDPEIAAHLGANRYRARAAT
jgi:hypothetical protein